MTTNKDKIRASAQKYLQKGQLDKAIREFERLVEDDPNDVRTLLKIGDLQTRNGDQAAATRTYTQVAKYYSDQGFFLKAVAVYKQILKLDPTLIDITTHLADLYHQLGLMSDAINQYRQIVDMYEKQDRLEDCMTILRKVVELDPDNIATRVKLAEIHVKQGLLEEARADFLKAALQLKAEFRTDDYVKVAERLIHVDPSDLATARELAEIYIKKGDARRALAKLQVCFRANPKDIETLTLLAQAFQELGQVPKAISVYRELVELYAAAHNTEGRAQALKKILALDPGDADAQFALSGKRPAPPPSQRPQATAQAGRPQAAAPAPASHRKRPPDDDEATNPGTVIMVEEVEDADMAEAESAPEPTRVDARLSGDADLSSPEAIEKLLVEADIYIKYGLRNKAIDHLHKILRLHPDHREAQERNKSVLLDANDVDAAAIVIMQMAQAAIHNKQPDLARSDLQELLELRPNDTAAKTLLATVASSGFVPDASVDMLEPLPMDGEVTTSDGIDDMPVLMTAPVGEDGMPIFDVPAGSGDEPIVLDEMGGPDIEVAAPDVDDSGPIIEVAPPDTDESGLTIEVAPPDTDESGPTIEVAPPDTDESGPTIEVAPPGTDESGPTIEVAPPGLDDDLGFSVDTSALDSDLSVEIDTDMAAASFSDEPAGGDSDDVGVELSVDVSELDAAAAFDGDSIEMPMVDLGGIEPPMQDRALPGAPMAAAPIAGAPIGPLPEPEPALDLDLRVDPSAGGMELDLDVLPPVIETELALAPEPAFLLEPEQTFAPEPKLALVPEFEPPQALPPQPEPTPALPPEPALALPPEPEFVMPPEPVAAPTPLPQPVRAPVSKPAAAAAAAVAPAAARAAPAKSVVKPAGLDMSDLDALISGAVPQRGAAVPAKAPVKAPVATSAAAPAAPTTITMPAPAPAATASRLALSEETTHTPIDISSELGEIEFFLQNGLLDEGMAALAPYILSHPNNPQVQSLQERIDALQAAEAPAPPPPVTTAKKAPASRASGVNESSIVESLLDTMDSVETEEELGPPAGSPALGDTPLTDADFQVSFADVFDAFKKGVEKQIDQEDFETHYNLGIAYKEMGLLDDALLEFKLTMRSPEHEVNALTMMGLCELALGHAEAALQHFMDGLASPHLAKHQTVALRYEVGLAYEGMGRFAEAAKFYEKALAMDPGFRDVGARFSESHRQATQQNAEADGGIDVGELDSLLTDDPVPVRKSSKISYL